MADKINMSSAEGGYSIESDIDKHWSYFVRFKVLTTSNQWACPI
jgi:hypothetical protein